MDTDAFIHILPGLLSALECGQFIQRAESLGYLATSGDYPSTYRDNDRIVIDDAELAGRLFQRFRHLLPERIGSWTLKGLNSRFRGCRYRNGQKFTRHRDGAHSQDRCRSFLTLMLYLNDESEFQGGHTRFYPDRWSPEPTRSVAPVRGAGIVFDHRLWHDGQAVLEGTKYVLRTDVMYEPRGVAAEGHSGYVWSLLELPDGHLASGSRDKTVRLWKDGRVTQVLTHHASSVTCLVAGDHCFWSGARDREIVIWRRRGERWSPARSFQGHQGAVLSMIHLLDGGVLSTGADNFVKVWDSRGNLRRETPCAAWPWTALQCADGTVLVGCDDGGIQRYDPVARRFTLLHRAPAAVLSLLVDSGGVLLAGCGDGVIRRWQRFKHPLQPWLGHRGQVTGLLRLADGRIVSGSEDDGVRVWSDGHSRELVRHHDFVRAICLTGDGRVLASASYDGSIRWTPVPEEINPRAMAFTDLAANPAGAISGTAAAT